MEYLLHPVGVVRSALIYRNQCPHQGKEGAPDAWIHVEPGYAEAVEGIEPGLEIVVLTWMHLADRSVLRVHPRGNQRNPITGVFKTRSADRPNPIGIHRVTVKAMDSPLKFLVGPLEVIDNTPVIDIKCVVDDV